MNRLQKM